MLSSTNSRWNICRICLKNSGQCLYSIFDEGNETTELGNLQDKIEQYGGIKVYPQNNLPNKICSRCLLLLKAAHKFRDLCEQSQEQLKQFINPLKEEEDAEDNIISKEDDDSDSVVITSSTKQRMDEFITDEKTNTLSLIEEYDLSTPADEDEDDDQYVYEEINESSQEAAGLMSEDTNSYEDSNMHFDYYETTNDDETKRESSTGATDGELLIPATRKAVKRKREIKIINESVYRCEYCENVYHDRTKYNLHVKLHNNVKPHECEICKKHFSTTSQLSRHMNSHTGNRPYKCNFCEASFGDPSTKIKHERIHTNERPYKCELCSKSFSYSNVLKVHMMVHTGEKPHVCAYCDKSFSQAHHKNAHEKRHLKVVVVEADNDLDNFEEDIKDFELQKH
ncbi:zinc finger protein 3 [Stomoxys calcitrans]|uniref:Protein krueppel n=1 Tax=Stomoxys calcitrans TaxID=35570 RepID=A0A1I8P0M2_STOCA|nr:zinc finger protein 3 [Stomoxys calcitrans]